MTTSIRPDQKPYLVASIMLATFMVAIEGTIVATAMPSIVGQLGGFKLYSWVFAAYLLAQALTTVIYGKLADVYGRKPTLLWGIMIFMAGSLGCGFATSMPALIVFRLLQGLGAGAIPPVTLTLIGDLYKIEERGRGQGTMASVWAASAVVGPLAGGLIVAHLTWAWIFWINLPVGILTLVGFSRYLHERIEPRIVRIDYLGALLFACAMGSLMMIFTSAAGAATLLALTSTAAIASGLFLLQERRAPEPLVSLELWSRRLIAAANGANLLTGIGLMGLTSVLPLFVQGVLGRSPVVAGLTVTMLVLGWPLMVMSSSRLYRRFGIRGTLVYGGVLLPLGAALLLVMNERSGPGIAATASFLMGCGMGLITVTSVALVQGSVPWSMRGSATASTVFARSLGSTVGATIVGAILNAGVTHFGSATAAGAVHEILNRRSGLADLAAQPAARSIFAEALHLSFIGVFVVSLLTYVTIWLIPTENTRHEDRPH